MWALCLRLLGSASGVPFGGGCGLAGFVLRLLICLFGLGWLDCFAVVVLCTLLNFYVIVLL